MTTPVRPARTVPHTTQALSPSRAAVSPVRRPAAQPVDPWRWHDYATRVAAVERSAWESAAGVVGHSAVDVRALCALRRTDRAVGALGSRLGLTSGGATKLCRRLVELGLVERRGMDEDLRGVRISLTEAGRDVAHRASLVYAEQVRRRAAEMHLAA
ncbi:MarR family winged helix-turn-helix transcriptional regulator [Jatrophihabitans sp. YIM 134969]